MKITVIDQIHISALSADTLRPGQEIEVEDEARARRFVADHPAALRLNEGAKAEPAAPKNKAEPGAPRNKAQPRAPRAKAKGAALEKTEAAAEGGGETEGSTEGDGDGAAAE